MSWDRIQRQEAILREKIAVIILDRLNDPRLGFVTITSCKLSRDKRYAKVLLTVLGTESQKRTTLRALQDAAPRVQELLAKTYKARTLPEIQFAYDGAVEKESRLLNLIESLEISSDDVSGEGEAGEESGESETGEGETGDNEASDDESGDHLSSDGELGDAEVSNEAGAGAGDEGDADVDATDDDRVGPPGPAGTSPGRA